MEILFKQNLMLLSQDQTMETHLKLNLIQTWADNRETMRNKIENQELVTHFQKKEVILKKVNKKIQSDLNLPFQERRVSYPSIHLIQNLKRIKMMPVTWVAYQILLRSPKRKEFSHQNL